MVYVVVVAPRDDLAAKPAARDVVEFDSQNHWLIDRGDAVHRPSVNLVVLAFVHPLKLLQQTTDATTLDGVPRGMTPGIVSYFTSRGSGSSCRSAASPTPTPGTRHWRPTPPCSASARRPWRQRLGVGIEIDYEQNSDPDIDGLRAFIQAYRAGCRSTRAAPTRPSG